MEQVRELGWQVEGIEFSADAAAIAQSKGFKVQVGSLETAREPGGKYDIVTAWMLLEHLHEPVRALKKLHDWVRPNGYLVALVPDAESLARFLFKERCYDLHLPSHLYHYTQKTLRLVLRNSGWRLERVFWQRNCSSLLQSAEYWASEKEYPRWLRLVQWCRLGSKAVVIRQILNLILGMTRQSGRLEFWARPIEMN